MQVVQKNRYPLPYFENLRVKNLHSLGILDTGNDPEFDRLLREATESLGTPLGAFSLVDRDRQWFKASVGLDVTETSREVSFCTHTIVNPGSPLVVPDSTASEVFRHNPMVTGGPRIRSYLGFPIDSPVSGLTIGSLCVIDLKPREFSPAELKLVGGIATSVTKLVKRRYG